MSLYAVYRALPLLTCLLCSVRWRAQRKALRTREAEADARDREYEARQLAALNERSDSFLAQHADLLASTLPPGSAANGSPHPGQHGTGGSTPAAAAAGVKLSFNAAAAKPAVQEAPKARPTALALEDEDENAAKKRELIPLEYSDEEDDAKPRLSRAEAERKAREIEEKVPSTQEGLWAWSVRWKKLTDVSSFSRRIAEFENTRADARSLAPLNRTSSRSASNRLRTGRLWDTSVRKSLNSSAL